MYDSRLDGEGRETREELIDVEKLDSVACSMGLKNSYSEPKGVSSNLKSSGQRVRFWNF